MDIINIIKLKIVLTKNKFSNAIVCLKTNVLDIVFRKINIIFEKIDTSKIYKFIEIISTLTIFSGLIIYTYGHIVKNNKSDNDLIMKQIYKEVEKDGIISISVADIHGFGNDSIIVTTSNAGLVTYEEKGNNNLLILDVTENEILHSMDDLLGLKSSYKTTFLYTICSDDVKFVPKTEYVLDIIGDSTKEIIVKYYVFGSNYGANGTAIFSYSYRDSKYQLIGTYPYSIKTDLHEYDKAGNFLAWGTQIVETDYENDSYDRNHVFRCYDSEKKFNLNHGAWSGREYWLKSSIYGYILVTVNVDYYNNTPSYVNIYQTFYDDENENLLWNLLFSENVEDFTDEFPKNYTEDDLIRVLMEILGGQISFVEKYSD